MNFGKEIEYGGFPNSETRTIAQKRRDADTYAGINRRKSLVPRRANNEPEQQIVVDTPTTHEVESLKPQDEASETRNTLSGATMTLTFKALSKNGKDAFYSGAARLLRFRLTDFVGGTAPSSIEVGDSFVPGKAPKVRMTKEERAAERANKPKPTEAERIARAEAQLAKRKAKLAAADQPSL